MTGVDPVAVQVEQVVVAAPVGPVAGVQHGLVVHVRLRAAALGQRLGEARAAVRVHARVDDDHDLVQQPARSLGTVGGEVMQHHQRGIGARALVAVDGIRQPGHARQRVDQPRATRRLEPARVGQRGHAGLDLRAAGKVLRAGDDEIHQRPALIAPRILDQLHAGRGRRDRLRIREDLLGRGGALADREAEHGLRRRDRGIVVGAPRVDRLAVLEARQWRGLEDRVRRAREGLVRDQQAAQGKQD